MYSVSFYVDHCYPDAVDSEDYSLKFNSLDDALMWASFYDRKSDQRDPNYWRYWGIRAIYRDRTRLNLSPMDYIHSDLSWDEIDRLPVEPAA